MLVLHSSDCASTSLISLCWYFTDQFVLVLQENRKLHLLKSQLDMYKRQVQEVQMKMADETKRGDKAEFELKRQQEKMVGLQKEKEVGTDGRDFVFVAQGVGRQTLG